jgi:hypothetical protein
MNSLIGSQIISLFRVDRKGRIPGIHIPRRADRPECAWRMKGDIFLSFAFESASQGESIRRVRVVRG